MDPFIGEIRIFCGTFAPQGWLLCQGQIVNIMNYQALYAVIGTHFGGNGSSTFGIPNLQGRGPVGTGLTPIGHVFQLGLQGGSEQIYLGLANLPVHNHTAGSAPHNHPVTVPAHDHSYTDLKHTHTIELGCDDVNGNVDKPSNAFFGVNQSGGGGYSSAHPDQMATQTTDQNAGTATGTTGQSSSIVGSSGPATATVTVSNAGSGAPFDPRNPFVAITYIIAYQGIYPVQP